MRNVDSKLLRIVVGSDRAGRRHKEVLADDFRASSLVASLVDLGVDDQAHVSYPEIAFAAAQIVADGHADRALLVCHTGLGMAIAANKIHGIRAATAHDSLSVKCAVLANNAQVLAFGEGVIGVGLARRLAAEWLTYRFDPESSAAAKVEAICALENQRRPR